jgi:hypothetical protein
LLSRRKRREQRDGATASERPLLVARQQDHLADVDREAA